VDAAAIWSRFREIVASNFSVAPIIEPLKLERLDAGIAVLSAPDAEALGAARTRRSAIEEGLTKAAGRPLRVDLRLAESAPRQQPALSPHAVNSVERERAMQNPLVRRAVELFDGRVVDVEDET
jgi:hypothetical protein